MAHLLISAAHKSSGKTTVTLGLCAALRQRGYSIQPFKKGPDYIDPMWLTKAAGRDCYNLDFFTMGREEILSTFSRQMQGAGLGIIEGNKGLYDGLDLDGSNSNAALAELLGAPVVLVLDARGMTRGIAPLILGYQAFDPNIRIAGVILNKVGGSRHESKLRAIIEHYTDVELVGAVHADSGLQIDERHLGLVPSNESLRAEEQIRHVADAIAGQVDLEKIAAIAAEATVQPSPRATPAVSAPAPDVRIGVARDSAFGFYYPGDLEALRLAGAELVEFNTLRDTKLPEVDGLFIGGGFPETHMEQLESNLQLREQLRHAINQGMPAYAECGGLMYLARSIRWGDRECAMVGILPADVVMHERPQGRGYIRLRETDRGLWPAAYNGTGTEINGHEFHYSSLENVDPELVYAYEVLRGTGVDGHHDGIVYKNLLANYAHLRDVENNHWANRFVQFVRAHKHNRAPQQATTH